MGPFVVEGKDSVCGDCQDFLECWCFFVCLLQAFFLGWSASRATYRQKETDRRTGTHDTQNHSKQRTSRAARARSAVAARGASGARRAVGAVSTYSQKRVTRSFCVGQSEFVCLFVVSKGGGGEPRREEEQSHTSVGSHQSCPVYFAEEKQTHPSRQSRPWGQ